MYRELDQARAASQSESRAANQSNQEMSIKQEALERQNTSLEKQLRRANESLQQLQYVEKCAEDQSEKLAETEQRLFSLQQKHSKLMVRLNIIKVTMKQENI